MCEEKKTQASISYDKRRNMYKIIVSKGIFSEETAFHEKDYAGEEPMADWIIQALTKIEDKANEFKRN